MDVLAERLEDEDADQRLGAIQMLGAHGARSVVLLPQIIEALKDPDKAVRETAASELGRISYCAPEQAVPHLVQALDDPEVRGPVEAALEVIGQQGQAALAEWRSQGRR